MLDLRIRNVSFALKRDPEADAEFGWMLEMWGYSIACARVGIKHYVWQQLQIEPSSTWHQNVSAEDPYIYHYTFGVEYSADGEGKGSAAPHLRSPTTRTRANRASSLCQPAHTRTTNTQANADATFCLRARHPPPARPFPDAAFPSLCPPPRPCVPCAQASLWWGLWANGPSTNGTTSAPRLLAT